MSRYLAIIPAAGTGTRMGAVLPKQYLGCDGRPLLYHAISRLCAHPAIEQVCLVLAPGDCQFETYDWQRFSAKLQPLYAGGPSRAASVLNALEHLNGGARADDWILVHDAARPCLSAPLLERLIVEVGEDRCGGLLAVPVTDTLKRAGHDDRSIATQARAGLWQAQTPQMFRYDLLLRAFRSCDLTKITDEAAAVETLGLRPKLVHSDATNFKVTHAPDLVLAQLLLQQATEKK